MSTIVELIWLYVAAEVAVVARGGRQSDVCLLESDVLLGVLPLLPPCLPWTLCSDQTEKTGGDRLGLGSQA